jgi:TolB-like protein/DNA-binding winged helix-turn-helix (wHTH) protein/Flp pilus assembly protein TadD
MAVPAEPVKELRFGEFEINLHTAELRRNGRTSVLQGQPFQVLAVLLEHPGELVTREELKSKLWTANTFVDFDHSLNKAVNRLREALEDSAEQPRYVQTIARRGYRLIAPVEFSQGLASPRTPELPISQPSVSTPEPAVSSTARVFRIRSHHLAIISAAVALVSAGLIWQWYRTQTSRSAAGEIHSLAVLPMENLSGDPSQDSLADAVTDQIITDLGRFGALRVISRTSVMQYKRVRKPLPQIARELRVDAIVEGAVIRSNDEVRITAQLIHGATDRHLWAESYKGNVRDVLALHERVAADIADKVLNRLGKARPQNLGTTTRSVDPDAFEEYLRGVSQSFTTDGRLTSIRYFNAAIEKQPNFAEAYVELAVSYVELGHMLTLPPQDSFPKAKAAALKAIALDEHLGGAHSMLGEVHLLYDWDFVGAEQEVRRGIELNPNRISNYSDYAEVLLATGRYEQAIQQIRRKEEIDPIAAKKSHSRAALLYYAKRYDEAITYAQNALAADPNAFHVHLWLGLALEQKHQFAAALAELKKAVELSNDQQWIGFIAHDLALSGDKAGARKILRQLEDTSKRTYVSPWWMAIVNSGLRDKEKTLYWLERAYEGREHDLVFSNCWPMFDFLSDDVRFKDLLYRIGLAQRKS